MELYDFMILVTFCVQLASGVNCRIDVKRARFLEQWHPGPLIPYDFLKGIFTWNFRDIGNLRPSVLGLIKMSFRVLEKKVS